MYYGTYCIMSSNTDKTAELKELYQDITGSDTFTEEQKEGPSKDPIGEAEAELEEQVTRHTRQTGLEDAVDQPQQQ